MSDVSTCKEQLYVPLSSLHQKLNGENGITITVECIIEKPLDDKSSFVVNFLPEHPKLKGNQDILFHFNLRPPNCLCLSTYMNKKAQWENEVLLTASEFKENMSGKPFELAIKQTKGDDKITSGACMSEFGVFVDGKFLTTYLCPALIKETKYISFSRNVRITANITAF